MPDLPSVKSQNEESARAVVEADLKCALKGVLDVPDKIARARKP